MEVIVTVPFELFLRYAALMDQRMEAMSKALEQRGITGHFNHLPDLEACEIVSAVEDGKSGGTETSGGER